MPSVTSGGNLAPPLRGCDWETSQDRGKDEWSKVQRDP
jgi:hypothetical protein